MSGVCGIIGGKGMRVAPPGCDEQRRDAQCDLCTVHVRLLTVVLGLGHDGGTCEIEGLFDYLMEARPLVGDRL